MAEIYLKSKESGNRIGPINKESYDLLYKGNPAYTKARKPAETAEQETAEQKELNEIENG